jgi:malonyl-CoA O-methyltransferase
MKCSPDENKAAFPLAHAVGEEMLARLEWMTIKPRVIVYLGDAADDLITILQKRYADAEIIIPDAREFVDGVLSCKDQSVDLLFANFVFPFVTNIETALLEFRRILRPDGLLMFTALGPDSLKEFSLDAIMVNLVDMHNVGDLLLKHFSDPVLDVDYYTLSYRKQSTMLQELKATGLAHLTDNQDILDVTLEVVFAHAFAPQASNEVSASEDGIVRIPLSHLRRR